VGVEGENTTSFSKKRKETLGNHAQEKKKSFTGGKKLEDLFSQKGTGGGASLGGRRSVPSSSRKIRGT